MGFPSYAMGSLTGCTDIVEYSTEDGKQWVCCENADMGAADNPKDFDGPGYGDQREVSVDEMMDELVAADKAGYIMVICTDIHARTLLNVAKNPAGVEVNLLQVRDQCGDGNLGELATDGTWGQDGSGWDEHPEVADLLGHKDKEGVFWINLEDCVKVMKCITICKTALPRSAMGNLGS